jgi:type II secretory pathway pseudopilin PulG
LKFGIRNSEFGIELPPTAEIARGRAEIPNSEFRIPNSREAGYTLVVVVMIIAVMAIMMAAAVEIVSFQAQREREAELIFRGRQYVEAIRLYKQKYGRNPMRMKELWEADPRVLRQKWKDPITDSEEWDLIFLGQEGRGLNPRGGRGRGRQPTPTRTPVFERERVGGGGGEKVGPIIGVRSFSNKESIKIYEGRTNYNDWKFVLKEEGSRQPPSRREDESPWGMPPTPIGHQPGGSPDGSPGGPPGSGGGDESPNRPPQGQTPRPRPTGTPTR